MKAHHEQSEAHPLETTRAGKIKYALVGWLLGLPLPIILLLLVFRGCDF